MNTILLQQTVAKAATSPEETLTLVLLGLGIVVLFLTVIAMLYLISSIRRKNVVLKKVDYLVEDITYKSESLNVTVETLNKVSNYALTMDVVSQKGMKSMIKLVTENKNYIYSIIEKLREDVESRERLATKKKPAAKKVTTAKKTTTAKKPAAKKTTTAKKKPAAKKK